MPVRRARQFDPLVPGKDRLSGPDRPADVVPEPDGGDHAVDLDGLHGAGVFDGLDLGPSPFADPNLNRYLATGPDTWRAVRTRLREVLEDAAPTVHDHVVLRSDLVMGVPVAPTDYVDFYSSIHHATNLGRMFRPDGDALMPNWRRIPIGYHGRTGTLVADGTPIRRPVGYRLVGGEPGRAAHCHGHDDGARGKPASETLQHGVFLPR